MTTGYFSYKFFAPRYWIIWLALLILRLMAFLPYSLLVKKGEALGSLLSRLNIRHRHIAEVNVAAAFPELDAEERKALVKANFKSTMISLFELPLFWWGSERRLKKLYRVEGMEHMEAALALGKGAILLGGHFTPMLMCGRLLAMELPFDILVMPAKNALFEAVMRHYRERYYAGIINSDDIRGMVKALKRNEICWYAPDQDLGAANVVFAPFMGIPTATMTSTARLAKLSGAPIVPINFERTPGNKGYLIKFLPHWEGFPSGDDMADATRINRFLEDHVRQVPEQYLWVHRRFKTRPAGEPGMY